MSAGSEDYIVRMLLGLADSSSLVMYIEHDEQEVLLAKVNEHLGRSLDVSITSGCTVAEVAADVNEALRAAGSDHVLAEMGPHDEECACFAWLSRRAFEELVAAGFRGIYVPTRT